MANAYVDELYSMNSHLAITEAAQRRVFFDQELADEKSALTDRRERSESRPRRRLELSNSSGQAEQSFVPSPS
jgi:tyrosine-protein kinase Etk/Wzc